LTGAELRAAEALATVLSNAVGATRAQSEQACVDVVEASKETVRCARLRVTPGFLTDLRFEAAEYVASYGPDGTLHDVGVELRLGRSDATLYHRLVHRLGAPNSFGVNYVHPTRPNTISTGRNQCAPSGASPDCRIATVVLDWRLPSRHVVFRRWGDMEALGVRFE
jgi:hypothetical protein